MQCLVNTLRSYYYDTETGWYYLQSRYYDPVIHRFINADAFASTGQGFLGCNMFAYCLNNPVNGFDPSGTRFQDPYCRSCGDINEYADTGTGSGHFIYYSTPLYSQRGYNLCWAFCAVMEESYRTGTVYTQSQARARAIRMAKDAAGSKIKRDWNKGGWPDNLGDKVSCVASINDLYDALVQNDGPIYAYYISADNKGAHLVLVIGVNTNKDVVYTNNPQGCSGEQSFSDFLVGFYSGHGTAHGYRFSSAFYISKCAITAVPCYVN